MDEVNDTPRVCEACGGDKSTTCHWCTSGFQNLVQQERWQKFRQRMGKISGTYSLFQGMVEELLERIDGLEGEEAQSLVVEGREALCKWLISEHGTPDRDEAGKALLVSYRHCLDYFAKR